MITEGLRKTVFHTGKWLGLFQLSRLLMRRRLMILCYHGFQLDDEARFRPPLFMRAEVFERRMAMIKRKGFPVLPLNEALQRLKQGTLPPNTIAITIDDGWYSFVEKAWPVLQRYSFSSTLYVTSYYAEKQTPVFRLLVQYMFWKTRQTSLQLEEQPWLVQQSIDLSDAQAKEQGMQAIIEYGEKQCDEPGRQAICRLLANALDIDYERVRALRSFSLASADELRQLEAAGVDVQLHTHRHIFPVDNPGKAQCELDENLTWLQQQLGGERRHFCYPGGVWGHQNFTVLEQAHIRSATTCEPGLNSRDTEPLALYRCLDQDDLSDIGFEAELYGFCEIIRTLSGKRRRSDMLRKRMN